MHIGGHCQGPSSSGSFSVQWLPVALEKYFNNSCSPMNDESKYNFMFSKSTKENTDHLF